MIKYKQPVAGFKPSVKAKIKAPEKSSFDWLGTVFKLSALFLLCIYLYGYGAAVGYAGYFGIPQSALFSSSSDLLGIASETLLHNTLYFFKTGGFFNYLWLILKSTFFIVLLYGFGVSFGWFFGISLGKNKQIPAFLIKVKNFFFPNASVHLNESMFATAIRSIWLGILFILAAIAAQSVLIVAAFVSFMVILIATIFGYFAAINHAELDIIRPAKCDAMQTRVQFIDTLEKQKAAKLAGIMDSRVEHTANCVKVTFSDAKGSKTIAGRSVIAGSDYILVYEMSGKTTRIPIKTAVIEAADDTVIKEVEMQNEKLLAAKTQ
jgi:hypothetical protein